MRDKKDLFKLLSKKEIYEILDGDTACGKYTLENGDDVEIKMPYLSGPNLCEICTTFGLPMEYGWGGGAASRWMYVEDLLNHCIDNGKCNEVLKYLFQKGNFDKQLTNCGKKEFERAYKIFVDAIIDKINRHLGYSGYELVIANGSFIIKSTSEKVEIEIPKISKVDRSYIRDIQERAIKDVEEENFDSAIGKAKTLLEEVFKYVLENRGIELSKSISMSELYKKVREEYGIKTGNEVDIRINKLISGLNTIVDAVVEMRNIASDSHGLGSKRVSVENHHALLVVNAAIIVADFILAVADNKME